MNIHATTYRNWADATGQGLADEDPSEWIPLNDRTEPEAVKAHLGIRAAERIANQQTMHSSGRGYFRLSSWSAIQIERVRLQAIATLGREGNL